MYALRSRANLKAGEVVLVLGAAGGVGTASIELGKYMGATVIAAASSSDKLEFCSGLGADQVISYSDLVEFKQKLRDLGGVDVVVDCVGGAVSEVALRCMNWNGRYLVVGFATGAIPRPPLNLCLLKGISIVGVFWGSWMLRDPEECRSQLHELMQLIASKKLKPCVTKIYRLEQAGQCLNDIDQRRLKGKAVIVMEHSRL